MLTPVDIQRKVFRKAAIGYSADEVDAFLNEIIISIEKLMNENIELKDKIATLNENLTYYKSLENTIQNTMIVAEKTAEETKEAARAKSNQIISEAEQKASTIVYDASTKMQEASYEVLKLKNQYESIKAKIRMLLTAQLDMLDNSDIDMMDFDIRQQ